MAIEAGFTTMVVGYSVDPKFTTTHYPTVKIMESRGCSEAATEEAENDRLLSMKSYFCRCKTGGHCLYIVVNRVAAHSAHSDVLRQSFATSSLNQRTCQSGNHQVSSLRQTNTYAMCRGEKIKHCCCSRRFLHRPSS
jgi:hypothetical protein